MVQHDITFNHFQHRIQCFIISSPCYKTGHDYLLEAIKNIKVKAQVMWYKYDV